MAGQRKTKVDHAASAPRAPVDPMPGEHRIALAVIPRFGRHRGVGGLEGGVKRMGIEALYRKRNTSKPAQGTRSIRTC